MKILVIGKNGMLGRYLTEYLHHKHEIVDTRNIDITSYKELHDRISKISNLDYIINCAAITDTTYCNTNKGMIESFNVNVNVNGVRNIAKICDNLGIHLIHISTDAVYSEYSNDENPYFPVNVYGCHKFIGENVFRRFLKIRNITLFSDVAGFME